MNHTLTEGGQITTHRMRMLKQVIKVAFLSSFLIGLCIFCLLMLSVPKVAYLAAWYYFKAWVCLGITPTIEVSREFLSYMGQNRSSSNLPIAYVMEITAPILNKFGIVVYSKFVQSIISAGICAILILLFFFYRGLISKGKKHLSGAKIVSAWWIRLSLKLQRQASPITIGNLPLIKGTETQHILITGGTGCGKTNCMHHLLAQLRKMKYKAIVVDTTGVFLERYYREGKDFLLNPFDSKGAEWNPWSEGQSNSDYASLAEAFIPSTNSETENYWRIAAKTVFTSMLSKLSDTKSTAELVKWIQYERLSDLCKLLEGTKAAAHMDISSEKTASSIRSVTSTFLECLDNLKDSSNPFSIKEWVGKKNDSWLFIQCNPSQRAILRPLISAWISSAVRGLLALPIDLKRRIWFAIDELPTLQKVKDLETLLTEGRKYGGCAVISLQSPAQLENIYGREVSKIIIGNTATKIIFRERDPEIAERISKAFGEREVIEIQEGISYGAHEARDGVNLSMQNKIRPVVSVSQILELPVNTAYVKLADKTAVAQVKFLIANP